MQTPSPICLSLGLTLAFNTFSVDVDGAEPAADRAAETTAAETTTADTVAPTMASAPDHPALILQQLSESAREDRLVSAWLGTSLGVAATGVGLLVDSEYDASYGQTVWILGLISLTGGLIEFLMPSPLERFAAEWGTGSPNYTPAALEAAWREEADAARSGRHVAGVIGLSLGGLGLGAGALVLAGVGDYDRSKEAELATISLLGGAGFATLGALAFVVKSPLERQYLLAYPNAAVSSLPLDVALVPTRGGGALQVMGSF